MITNHTMNIRGSYAKYSIDCKNMVARLYLKYKSYRKLSTDCQIPRSTIFNWVTNHPVVQARRDRRAYNRKCTESVQQYIQHTLDFNGFISSAQLVADIERDCNVSVSCSTVRRYAKSLDYTYKKGSKVPCTTALDALRQKYAMEHKDLDPDDVLSIDETSFYFDTQRRYGRAKRGRRLHSNVHHTFGRRRLSLIMAIGTQGIVHSMLIHGSVNSQVFAAFIDSIPTGTKKTLLLDNVSFHKSDVVQSVCKRRDFISVYLPPYTPDFQPIEHVFGVLKNRYSKLLSSDLFSWDDMIRRISVSMSQLPDMFSRTFEVCWARMKRCEEHGLMPT